MLQCIFGPVEKQVMLKCSRAYGSASPSPRPLDKSGGYQQKEFEYLEKVNDLSHECMIKTTTTTLAWMFAVLAFKGSLH